MPLQRESVGEYLWDPKNKWVLAETFLWTVLFIKYLLLWTLCPRVVVYLCSHHCWEEQHFCTGRCRMQAELRFQPQVLLLCWGTGGGGWTFWWTFLTFSRPSPDILQTFSRPSPDLSLGWWLLKGTFQAEWWSEGIGCWARGSAPIPELQLIWSHLRSVSLAQAALPLEGVGDIWNFQPFGVTQALLTHFYSLWTLVSHPVEHSLDPTAVPISNNEISKWNHS